MPPTEWKSGNNATAAKLAHLLTRARSPAHPGHVDGDTVTNEHQPTHRRDCVINRECDERWIVLHTKKQTNTKAARRCFRFVGVGWCVCLFGWLLCWLVGWLVLASEGLVVRGWCWCWGLLLVGWGWLTVVSNVVMKRNGDNNVVLRKKRNISVRTLKS